MSEPAILVGRRPDGGHRDRLWAFCRDRWADTLGWPIAEGRHEGAEPFSLAAASNDAAAIATRNVDWTAALYIGADFVLGSPQQAQRALEIAERRGRLVFCHDQHWRLSEIGTEELLSGARPADAQKESGPHRNTFSGALVVPRALWENVGGFDERFTSWGWEDLALWSACSALAGGYERVPGPLYHLWHPPVTREDHVHEPLGRRYIEARTNRSRMLAILREREAA